MKHSAIFSWDKFKHRRLDLLSFLESVGRVIPLQSNSEQKHNGNILNYPVKKVKSSDFLVTTIPHCNFWQSNLRSPGENCYGFIGNLL